MIHNTRISAIVAIDEKRGMGKNNSIPWHIPGEQKMFKEITMPHPMIMGRRTFESIGRILPGRPHIIITRDTNYEVEGVTVVNSLEEGLDIAKQMEEAAFAKASAFGSTESSGQTKSASQREIFIIGGGQIFKEAFDKDLVDRLYLTIVEGDYDADVFFPDYSKFTKVILEENREVEEYKYKFLTLEK